MNAYTKGSWAVMPLEAGVPYIRIRGTTPGLRYKIANVLEPIYEGSPEYEAAETLANARLIGAAPDLYDALKTFVWPYQMNCRLTEHERVEKARAAIAKVMGLT